jgi:anti-sigma B factor antagonist
VLKAMRRFLRWLEGNGRTRNRASRPYWGIEPLEGERGFCLSGGLDLYSVNAVREALEPELHGHLVLDLAAVDFMDDDGLGLLVRVFRSLREQGGSLVLRNPQGRVLHALEITGLARIPGLTIERDE